MNYHVAIMSEDPDDHSEDPHQKYGLRVEAKTDQEAAEKAKEKFRNEYGNLPIFWVKVIKL